jgi:hypothetical protein
MLILSTKRHGTSALNVILMEMEAEICTRKWDTEVKKLHQLRKLITVKNKWWLWRVNEEDWTNKIMAVHWDELSLDLHKLLQQRPIPLAVASKGEGLKPLDRWDRFPLRAWMFFSRVCSVSCRAAFATNWSFDQRNSTHFRHETCQNVWRSKNLFLSGQQTLIKNTLMCNLRMWFPNVMLFMTIIGVIKTLVLFQHNGLIFNVHLNDEERNSKRSLHLHLDHFSVLDHAICTLSILLLTLSDNMLPFRCLQTHNFLFAVI